MWRNPPATTSTRPTQSRTISQIVSAWPSLVTTPLSIAYLTTSGAATAPACQNRPELTAPRTPPDCERTTSRTKRQAEPRRSSASPMALTYPPPEGAFRRRRLTHAVGRGTSSCDDPQGAHPSRAFAGSARSGVRDGRGSCGGHHGAQRRVRLQRLPRGLDGDGRRPPGRHLADARGRGRRADDHARPQLVGRRRAGLLPPQGGARRLQGDGADQGDRDTERAADGELVAFRPARAAGDRQCRERELGRVPQRPDGRPLGARAQDDPRQPLGPGARSHPARLDRAPNRSGRAVVRPAAPAAGAELEAALVVLAGRPLGAPAGRCRRVQRLRRHAGRPRLARGLRAVRPHRGPAEAEATLPRRTRRAADARAVPLALNTVRRVPREPIETRFPRPSVMGVVNVTPDSFSDAGATFDPADAVASARRMVAEGAAIVDVGGESTRPGAEGISADEELRRVVPVLEQLQGEVPVSIDTSKAPVARRALELGAELVNDVTALRADPGLTEVVAESGAYLCLMHMQGEPRTMQADPRYGDVASEVRAFLEERLRFAVEVGVDEERICVDPGIGFGKTVEQNFELVRRLDELTALGRPVVVGFSRKSSLGKLLGDPAATTGSLAASLGAGVAAYERGATILRVHDVREHVEALAAAQAALA